ncbi:hypothetical protein [Niallia circulans]|uniref:Uncharacterized protein n=1 Tax=Niallia circulans TaxID=1397 RepID=A0A941JL39_NIACI|nr:hypothetical protein [Niallia circulans]MCB5235459.1 hypothetical protein [Niallia circulans]
MFDLSNLTEQKLLEKLLLIKGVNRNGFIELIRSTRHYELGLELAELFESLLDRNLGQLDKQQIDSIKLLVIQTRLICLDSLDRWNAFIEYFDNVYSQGYDNFGIQTLLIIQQERYQVIKRKIAKVSSGKKLGNSLHKPQSELTDTDIELRAKNIIDWVNTL